MTFAITIGRYGGFYVHFGYIKRICLGWITFDIYPKELEDIIVDLQNRIKKKAG